MAMDGDERSRARRGSSSRPAPGRRARRSRGRRVGRGPRGGVAGGDVVVDVDSGIFGHRVSMLDFTPRDLARFRAIGEIVGFPDRPPEVLTALALSGSAAQGKVQAFPGDCDYFERIHITAPTREDACSILAREMRAKALETRVGPTYRLWEVKFGGYPFDGERDGQRDGRKGAPISWSADEVAAGRSSSSATAGRDADLGRMAGEPGWCKLDWIVADPVRRALANASNMLDVTWEAPDGRSRRSTGSWTPTSRRSTWRPSRCPLFHEADRASWPRTPWTSTSPAGARGRQVRDQGRQLRQGRPAAVQHLPADRPLCRGRLPARAVRRADHGALPGRGPRPDPGRGGPARRRVRDRDHAPPDGRR